MRPTGANGAGRGAAGAGVAPTAVVSAGRGAAGVLGVAELVDEVMGVPPARGVDSSVGTGAAMGSGAAAPGWCGAVSPVAADETSCAADATRSGVSVPLAGAGVVLGARAGLALAVRAGVAAGRAGSVGAGLAGADGSRGAEASWPPGCAGGEGSGGPASCWAAARGAAAPWPAGEPGGAIRRCAGTGGRSGAAGACRKEGSHQRRPESLRGLDITPRTYREAATTAVRGTRRRPREPC
ncbi:hypothetical protein GCM10009790_27420 [Georgenia ruanii]